MKKRCSKCDREKSLNQFPRDKRYAFGVRCWCKACKQKEQKRRYHASPEKHREMYYQWRRKNPDKVKATKKRAYEKRKAETGLTGYETKEAKAKRMAKYREKHREELRQKSRERYHKMTQTPEGRRYWRALVQRRLNKGSYIDAATIGAIESNNIRRYGVITCEYCKIPIGETYHLDHKIPIVRGGSSQKVNLCIACSDCNLSKGSLTPEEYRQRLRVV